MPYASAAAAASSPASSSSMMMSMSSASRDRTGEFLSVVRSFQGRQLNGMYACMHVLRDKMNGTAGFVNCFYGFPKLALAAWQQATRLLHEWNAEKTVSEPCSTVEFVS